VAQCAAEGEMRHGVSFQETPLKRGTGGSPVWPRLVDAALAQEASPRQQPCCRHVCLLVLTIMMQRSSAVARRLVGY